MLGECKKTNVQVAMLAEYLLIKPSFSYIEHCRVTLHYDPLSPNIEQKQSTPIISPNIASNVTTVFPKSTPN